MPAVSGGKRADWLALTAQLLVSGNKYCQVVFTIPDKLSSLALGNRRAASLVRGRTSTDI